MRLNGSTKSTLTGSAHSNRFLLINKKRDAFLSENFVVFAWFIQDCAER
jgi:hypothetical protein